MGANPHKLPSSATPRRALRTFLRRFSWVAVDQSSVPYNAPWGAGGRLRDGTQRISCSSPDKTDKTSNFAGKQEVLSVEGCRYPAPHKQGRLRTVFGNGTADTDTTSEFRWKTGVLSVPQFQAAVAHANVKVCDPGTDKTSNFSGKRDLSVRGV